jgi:hypothetical protein
MNTLNSPSSVLSPRAVDVVYDRRLPVCKDLNLVGER